MEADVLPAGTQSVDGMNTHLKKGCLGVRRLAVQHHECVHTCRSLAFQLWIVLYNRCHRRLGPSSRRGVVLHCLHAPSNLSSLHLPRSHFTLRILSPLTPVSLLFISPSLQSPVPLIPLRSASHPSPQLLYVVLCTEPRLGPSSRRGVALHCLHALSNMSSLHLPRSRFILHIL